MFKNLKEVNTNENSDRSVAFSGPWALGLYGEGRGFLLRMFTNAEN